MLKEITVVEISTLIAGPHCAMLLGEMGANVIKVEPPGFGDSSRDLAPPSFGDEATFYLSQNRNKKGLALNIGKQEGWEVLMKLVETADVFIHNLRPNVASNWKIDYDDIRAVNDGIVYCALTGFGEEGPYRMKPASDSIFQGMSGVMMVSGEEGDPPVRLGLTPADMSAGLYATIGIVSALYNRTKTGDGQKVSVSLIDSLLSLQSNRITEYLATGKNPVRTGCASPLGAPIEYFKTHDGYINISVFRRKFWKRLCTVLDVQELYDDPQFKDNLLRMKNSSILRDILSPIFTRKTTEEWREVLDKADIPNGPIYSYSDVLSDPQVVHNEMIVDMEHSKVGPIQLVNQPIRFSKTPALPKSPPPALGEHTIEILKRLDLSDNAITMLKEKGVVGF